VWTLRRQAARVVLLDGNDRVLLLHATDPANASKGSWWELPGGGMESGEESAAAASRELYEETGIGSVDMGPCVWRHHAKFTFGGFNFDQHEHIHVARLTDGRIAGAGSGPDAGPDACSGGDAEGAATRAGGSAVPAAADYRDPEGRFGPAGLEPLEAMAFKGFKWWTSGEVIEMVTAGTRIIPPWLPDQLSAYLSGTIAAGPVDMGELGNAF
jgi:ADP-ribose pyrophosphatase YjhB (NUDIX family)